MEIKFLEIEKTRRSGTQVDQNETRLTPREASKRESSKKKWNRVHTERSFFPNFIRMFCHFLSTRLTPREASQSEFYKRPCSLIYQPVKRESNNTIWDVIPFPRNKRLSHWSGSQWSTRATIRGPPGSTIIIYKHILRFNNNNHLHPRATPFSSRQRAHSRYGFLPHFVGGNDVVKRLLLSPYPAIPPYVVRTPHSGRADDQEQITSTNVSSLEHDTWSRATLHTRWWDSWYSPTENIMSNNVSAVERDAWSRATSSEGGHVDATMTHRGRPFNFWRESSYENQNSCGHDDGHDDAKMTCLVKCVRILRR